MFDLEKLPQRIKNKIMPEPNSGCWLWMGAIDIGGYGVTCSGKHQKVTKAHRFVFKSFHGGIDINLCLDHLFRVHSCVNPAHLEQVTHRENMRRNKPYIIHTSHCPHGHEYNDANAYITFDKKINKQHKVCRACDAARGRKKRTKIRLEKLNRS